jgi:hypothetical protein
VTIDYLLGRVAKKPESHTDKTMFCKFNGDLITFGEINQAILKLSADARIELVKYIELLAYKETH